MFDCLVKITDAAPGDTEQDRATAALDAMRTVLDAMAVGMDIYKSEKSVAVSED